MLTGLLAGLAARILGGQPLNALPGPRRQDVLVQYLRTVKQNPNQHQSLTRSDA
jgi:hypothetical protein